MSVINPSANNGNPPINIPNQIQNPQPPLINRISSYLSSSFAFLGEAVVTIVKLIAAILFINQCIKWITSLKDYLVSVFWQFIEGINKNLIPSIESAFKWFFIDDDFTWKYVTVSLLILLCISYIFLFPQWLIGIIAIFPISILLIKGYQWAIKNHKNEAGITYFDQELKKLRGAIQYIEGLANFESIFNAAKKLAIGMKINGYDNKQVDEFIMKDYPIPNKYWNNISLKNFLNKPRYIPIYCPVTYRSERKNITEAMYLFCNNFEIEQLRQITYKQAMQEIHWEEETQRNIVEALKIILEKQIEEYHNTLNL